MNWTPLYPQIFVKVPKAEQRDRLEKIGVLYYPPEYAYMKRGMQCGEIVDYDECAKDHFPELKNGHILLFHHFIEHKETKSKRKCYQIDEDKDYNYYAVTAMEHNGERSLAFGLWDGEALVPNKDYIFLFPEPKPESDLDDFHFNTGGSDFRTNIAMKEASAGLVVPKERKLSREELSEKMKQNMERIKKIAPFLRMRSDVKWEIEKLEAENVKMSKLINKTSYEPYEIAGINESYQRFVYDSFGCLIGANDIVYILNIATHMRIEFLGNEYIVSQTKYIFSPAEWITTAIKKFNHKERELY